MGLSPSILIFPSEDVYREFQKKIAKKNLRKPDGQMIIAKYAFGLINFPEDFSVGSTIATAVHDLKTRLAVNAVLGVDTFRGQDSGEDFQITVVTRTKAFVFNTLDDDDCNKWIEELKKLQPEVGASTPVFSTEDQWEKEQE